MFEIENSQIVTPPDKIQVYMDQVQQITDISQLLNISFNGFKIVREVKSSCVFDNNIELIDLKLDVFGP